jgi:hypothetical protein
MAPDVLNAVQLIIHLFLISEAFIFLINTQWECILSYDNSTVGLKTKRPGGIRTWDLLVCRRTLIPLCHAELKIIPSVYIKP